MKYHRKDQPGQADHTHCFDGLCATMDRLGVPRNSKWRALILFMSSIKDYDIYSPEQKRRIQALVVAVLKGRDLTDAKFLKISREAEEILSGPWRAKLQAALGDLAAIVTESRGMIFRRKGDVLQLGDNTIESVRSGRDLEEVLDDIRRGFRGVVQYMEEDAENLERLSFTDSLTGLDNRRAFEEALSRAVTKGRQKGQPVCMLMADIDHFKEFNDRYGHPVGDQALSAVGAVIRECQRQAQERGGAVFAARYGGEEFAVILENTNLMQAMAVAEHIRHRIETYNFVIRDLDGKILDSSIKLTISVGAACRNEKWTDAVEQRLVNDADEALYAAKEAGRNRVMAHDQ
jgi:diguanylate cyclase (GGDEF)-like protein